MDNSETKTITTNDYEYHTKEVEVGGEIFAVQYFEYIPESNYSFNKQSGLPKLRSKITTLFHRIKFKTRKTWWDIRHGFERMFKRYDEDDVFDMSDSFINRYHKILVDYRENCYRYPSTMTKEEWRGVTDEMLYHLDFMNEDFIETVIDETDEDTPANWLPTTKTIHEIRDWHKNKFFELFSKYFYDLWS